ncbi:CPBP family intramembrane glutamic endopeptidase [Zavarzinella formosa]|uniref:CPBP family intramembrane glutamic endopeptidase n=1 Tax=Zavarzinella formosa TaxID=360055 RepID=UPI0002D8DBD0|nr:CPBP family intramembrane glutamic endopeptidase [Zavarzinella formosa]
MNYLSATRHPWPCLIFLVPLLGIYECGVIWLGGPNPDKIRNGADTWLRHYLGNAGADPRLVAPGVIIGLLLIWTVWRWKDRPEQVLAVVFGMALESVMFAGVLWVIASNFSSILGHYGFAMNLEVSREKAADVVTYIGAGIYEEAIFRLILCAGLARLLNFVLIPWVAAVPMAILASSVLFSVAHHVGPNADSFDQTRFLFRIFAGVFFAVIFWWRGFGVAAGTHAGYDIIVGLPSS